MIGHAQFSEDRIYRYSLERHWGKKRNGVIMFIGLNPSTADAEKDDPTIRRCIGFSKALGAGGYLMGNLFAYRSTDPKALKSENDPVGPDNDHWLLFLALRSLHVIAAWGAFEIARERGIEVRDMLSNHGISLLCLGVTKDGHPRHPLYLPKNSELRAWNG